jgi:putative tricarboxylic transport membrane protein
MQKGDLRTVILPLIAFVTGVVVIVTAWGFADNFTHDGLGSRLLPISVGIGICISSALVALEGYRGLGTETLERLDLYPPILVAAGLLFMYFFVWSLGWIVSATVLFVLVSKAFKEKRNLATLGIGLAMSTGTYVAFTYLLGIRLPAGQLFDRIF